MTTKAIHIVLKQRSNSIPKVRKLKSKIISLEPVDILIAF